MTQQNSLGVIDRSATGRRVDYLYRVSVKGLVRNENGDVLVVKESGRDWWDLPGGGMDHGEDLKTSIAREMNEEVGLRDDFSFRVLHVDEPVYLEVHDFWQLRLVFGITPKTMNFSVGSDADAIAFIDPVQFKESTNAAERRIYAYSRYS